MALVKPQKRRQSIRLAAILVSFLLFPVTINYLSPYVIIDGASQGIINGSFLTFGLLFLSSLFLGRIWCAWICPGAGLQRACFGVNDRRVRGGRLAWIKWGIWIAWIGVIALLAISVGGYRTINVLHLTDSVISVDEPSGYIKYFFVVGIILILSFTAGRRALCQYGCWMAPFMIIGRKIRNLFKWPALRLRSDGGKCIHCLTCTKNCPMSLDVHRMVQQGAMENSECILCGTCVDGCPEGAIAYSSSSR